MSTVNTEKLTLKLAPEVAKVLPWLIHNKVHSKPKLVEWAKREFEIAQERARAREEWEAGREEREREAEARRQWRAERETFWREYDDRLRETWGHEDRERQEMAAQRKHWRQLGFPSALEEGFLELQPAYSSQKGWRRLKSECADLWEKNRYGQWGCKTERANELKRNCGRKPRKPWLK